MSEVNSLASNLIFGQDVTATTPDTSAGKPHVTPYEAPAEPEGKSAPDLASELLGLPPLGAEEVVQEVEEQEVVSEESEDGDDNTVEESTDDETPIEESDDEDELEEVETPDDVWDTEELKTGSFEIVDPKTGETKHYTWDQIQNQFNRARSASEKTKEAKEQLESLELEREALTERESRIQQLDITNEHQREMVILDAQYRQVQGALANPDLPDGQYRQQMQLAQQIQERFQTVQGEYDASQKSLYQELPTSISDYASSTLSESSIKAAKSDPQLQALIEKASKWDNSQKKIAKAKPKLKSRKSSKKGSSSNVQDPVTVKQEAANARAKRGIATDEDLSLMRGSVMSGIIGSFGQ